MKRLWCRLFGHRLEWRFAGAVNLCYCTRCTEVVETEIVDRAGLDDLERNH